MLPHVAICCNILMYTFPLKVDKGELRHFCDDVMTPFVPTPSGSCQQAHAARALSQRPTGNLGSMEKGRFEQNMCVCLGFQGLVAHPCLVCFGPYFEEQPSSRIFEIDPWLDTLQRGVQWIEGAVDWGSII